MLRFYYYICCSCLFLKENVCQIRLLIHICHIILFIMLRNVGADKKIIWYNYFMFMITKDMPSLTDIKIIWQFTNETQLGIVN